MLGLIGSVLLIKESNVIYKFSLVYPLIIDSNQRNASILSSLNLKGFLIKADINIPALLF